MGKNKLKEAADVVIPFCKQSADELSRFFVGALMFISALSINDAIVDTFENSDFQYMSKWIYALIITVVSVVITFVIGGNINNTADKL